MATMIIRPKSIFTKRKRRQRQLCFRKQSHCNNIPLIALLLQCLCIMQTITNTIASTESSFSNVRNEVFLDDTSSTYSKDSTLSNMKAATGRKQLLYKHQQQQKGHRQLETIPTRALQKKIDHQSKRRLQMKTSQSSQQTSKVSSSSTVTSKENGSSQHTPTFNSASSSISTSNTDRLSRIVGGEIVNDTTKYPFYVVSAGSFLCGGTLIYPDIVLSTAHCNGTFLERGVLIGTTYLNGIDAIEVISVESEYIHPNYQPGGVELNDIMLVKLLYPSTLIQPVLLNFDSDIPVDNETAVVIGFGYTDVQNNTDTVAVTATTKTAITTTTMATIIRQVLSERLREGTVEIMNFEYCTGFYNNSINDATQICAGSYEGAHDACQGDSGGPLLQISNTSDTTNRFVQIGIISNGEGCGLPGTPAVYTRVSGYQDWILNNICILSSDPPTSCLSASNDPSKTNSPSPSLVITTTTSAPTPIPLLSPPPSVQPTAVPSQSVSIVTPTTEEPTDIVPTISSTEVSTVNPTKRNGGGIDDQPSIDPTQRPNLYYSTKNPNRNSRSPTKRPFVSEPIVPSKHVVVAPRQRSPTKQNKKKPIGEGNDHTMMTSNSNKKKNYFRMKKLIDNSNVNPTKQDKKPKPAIVKKRKRGKESNQEKKKEDYRLYKDDDDDEEEVEEEAIEPEERVSHLGTTNTPASRTVTSSPPLTTIMIGSSDAIEIDRISSDSVNFKNTNQDDSTNNNMNNSKNNIFEHGILDDRGRNKMK